MVLNGSRPVIPEGRKLLVEWEKIMKKQKGFTLVEILIVVVILGILAAIVIPQFTQAGNEARESSLMSNLQAIRSQLQLYRIQHLDEWPATLDLLEDTTDIDGDAWVDLATSGTAYGPYMRAIPVNPFSGQARVAAATGALVDWVYVVADGTITADDGGTSPDGTLHSAL